MSDNNDTGGSRLKQRNYWLLYMPTYYKANKSGYVYEHVYFYEQYNKCCILPWGNTHHIEPVTPEYCNNMPWNLQCMMARDHTSLHSRGRHKDTSNRRCYRCKRNKTRIMKPVGEMRTPCPQWMHMPYDKKNWYCYNCYTTLCNRLKRASSSVQHDQVVYNTLDTFLRR